MKKFHLFSAIGSLVLLLGIMIGITEIGSDLQSANHKFQKAIYKWANLKDHTLHSLEDYLNTRDTTDARHFRRHYNTLLYSVQLSRDILNEQVPIDSIDHEIADVVGISMEQARSITYYSRRFESYGLIDSSVNAWYEVGDKLGEAGKMYERIDRYARQDDPSNAEYRALRQDLQSYISSVTLKERAMLTALSHTTEWLNNFVDKLTWGFGFLLFAGGTILLLITYRRFSLHQKKYQQLFTNAEMAIVYMDQNSNILEINQAFRNLFGYDLHEIQGKNIDKFLAPPSKREEAYDLTRQSMDKRRISKTTWRHNKEGDRIDVIIGAVPVEVNGRLQGIFGLYYNISDLVQSQKKLQQSLEEKQILIQEIHHRVKNNLAVIAGLLDLQMDATEDSDTRHILRDSQSRIYSMAMIHELLYNNKNLSQIAFDEYLNKLVDHFRHTHLLDSSHRLLQTNTEHFTLNINQAIPCGLIINELVSNALEHAFEPEQSGTIEVETEIHEQNKITIIIRDDGIGFSPQQKPTHSIGLNIVDNLVEQLDGKIDIQSDTQTGGTEIIIHFEKEELKGSASIMESE